MGTKVKQVEYVHVLPTPFKGLKINIKDGFSVMMSVAANSLIMETKKFSWEKGIQFITPRELFYTLMNGVGLESVARRILRKLNVDEMLAGYLAYHRISIGNKNKCSIDEMEFDNDFCALIKRAEKEAEDARQKYIWTHHLLLALFDDKEKPQKFLWSPNRILCQALTLNPDKVKNVVDELLNDFNAKEEPKAH